MACFRNLGIGVCPEGEEILVGGERQDAIGIRSCEVFDCKALVRAAPRYANALVQQFQTMSLWSVLRKTRGIQGSGTGALILST